MTEIDFSEISSRYEHDSFVQRSAAERLLSLVHIGPAAAVLDLGCGTGHLTRQFKKMTTGEVVGVDSSEGMIIEALAASSGLDISFRVLSAEALEYENAFDVVFCNSCFQWFKMPDLILNRCWRALKTGGSIGIQAPATRTFYPNFARIVNWVRRDPRTKNVFAHFRSPWFFLETVAEYMDLFERCGFEVPFAAIHTVKSMCSTEDILKFFESGAAAGYFNQDHYGVRFNDDYIADFRQIVKDDLTAQADTDGTVELVFRRLYLIASKDWCAE